MHPPLVSPTRHAHSATTLLVHVVWSTHGRARSLAVGNAADHVHTLVRHPPTLAVAELAQRLKGASARALLPALQRRGDHLWQAGYWAETVAPHDLRAVVAYIRDQRTHHELADLREPWETT
jgi:putative transposase